MYTFLPEIAGARDGGWGWGAEAVDFDHDGWVDIIETNGWWESSEWMGETSYLFRNNGDGTFSDISVASGVRDAQWGWATEFLDYNNDGLLDIYAVNGFITGPDEDDL